MVYEIGGLRSQGATKYRKGVSYMPSDQFGVDFNRTYDGAMLLAVEAKMQRENKSDPKSKMVQAHDADGVPKWSISLAVATKNFEQMKFETIQVTVTSPTKPYGAIPPGTPVTVENMVVGIMTASKGGFIKFYSADAIRPLQAVHPAQPARVASGQ